jgi:hypothetical protein
MAITEADLAALRSFLNENLQGVIRSMHFNHTSVKKDLVSIQPIIFWADTSKHYSIFTFRDLKSINREQILQEILSKV